MTRSETLLSHHLAQFISDHKKSFIDKVLDQRTRYITVVLENIYQSQNASAVIRTCECMGLQDIHVIENTAKYELNVRVLKGSNKWINIERHRAKNVNNTAACFERLRHAKYRILVADPSEDGTPVEEVDIAQGKLAVVFGNELRGASEFALSHSDSKVRIPMYGFTESLNISVSVAICLNTLVPKIRASVPGFGLDPQEKEAIRLAWYRKMVRRSDVVEREFLRTIE